MRRAVLRSNSIPSLQPRLLKFPLHISNGSRYSGYCGRLKSSRIISAIRTPVPTQCGIHVLPPVINRAAAVYRDSFSAARDIVLLTWREAEREDLSHRGKDIYET